MREIEWLDPCDEVWLVEFEDDDGRAYVTQVVHKASGLVKTFHQWLALWRDRAEREREVGEIHATADQILEDERAEGPDSYGSDDS